MIVYISIGNSDDKLTQKMWSNFWKNVDALVTSRAYVVHGRWMSAPNDAFQNACWCVDLDLGPAGRAELKNALKFVAREYKQDSIAWAAVKETEFL